MGLLRWFDEKNQETLERHNEMDGETFTPAARRLWVGAYWVKIVAAIVIFLAALVTVVLR